MQTQLASGDRIGDWVIVGRLGAGGMGSVYQAHSSLSTQVRAAVKLLGAVHDAGARERFVRELELLASLDHPGIVRVLGGGQHGDQPFLVMELVEGKDLTWFIEGKALPWADACRIARDAAAALAAAHARGVFHRDLKPANLMLADDGRVKLIDFGIAFQEDQTRLTRANAVPGTMSYLPPEVFGAVKPDPARGDVYALGVVLHEMLTGLRAYPEDPDLTTVQRFAAVMGRKASDACLDPGEAVPARVRELVKAATSKDPTQRIPDAASLANALHELTQGTRPTGSFTPVAAPDRSRRTDETFTLEPAAVESAPPPPVKAPPRPRPRHELTTFPVVSLVLSAASAVLPPGALFFGFFLAILMGELGAMLVALVVLFAPFALPPLALFGLMCTAWFAVRVRRASHVPAVWWAIAAFLVGLHVWHIFLALADAAWIVSLVQNAASTRPRNWRDLVP